MPAASSAGPPSVSSATIAELDGGMPTWSRDRVVVPGSSIVSLIGHYVARDAAFAQGVGPVRPPSMEQELMQAVGAF